MKIEACVCSLMVLAMIPAAFAGKTELTTYYPSPYGEYTNLYVSGNVGIGTTNATARLHIQAGGGVATTYSDIKIGGQGGWASGEEHTINAIHSGGNVGSIIFHYDATTSGSIRFANIYNAAESSAISMTINGNGNVGIGTTVPISKLDALGTLSVGNAATAGAIGKVQITTDGASPINNRLTFGTDGSGWKFAIGKNQGGTVTEYMTFQDNGNVGIGTTAPSYKLHVSTDSAGKPTTNLWTIASDARIKKNVADFKDGLDIAMKLRPRTYQYNGLGGKGYDDPETHIGFVAQEIESITPYMVETRKGEIGGTEVDDFKEYQGHALPFVLLNAIQELKKEISELKIEVAELKKK